MLQEILQKVEMIIHSQMVEKFGLTQEESEQSTTAFRDELNQFLEGNSLFSGNFIDQAISNVQNLQDGEALASFKVKLAITLEEKVGLSPEMAAKVRDFSITTFYQTVKTEFTDETGNIDLQKLVGKLKLGELESTARELLGTFGQKFGVKQ